MEYLLVSVAILIVLFLIFIIKRQNNKVVLPGHREATDEEIIQELLSDGKDE